jgi:hypothetical protein
MEDEFMQGDSGYEFTAVDGSFLNVSNIETVESAEELTTTHVMIVIRHSNTSLVLSGIYIKACSFNTTILSNLSPIFC